MSYAKEILYYIVETTKSNKLLSMLMIMLYSRKKAFKVEQKNSWYVSIKREKWFYYAISIIFYSFPSAFFFSLTHTRTQRMQSHFQYWWLAALHLYKCARCVVAVDIVSGICRVLFDDTVDADAGGGATISASKTANCRKKNR